MWLSWLCLTLVFSLGELRVASCQGVKSEEPDAFLMCLGLLSLDSVHLWLSFCWLSLQWHLRPDVCAWGLKRFLQAPCPVQEHVASVLLLEKGLEQPTVLSACCTHWLEKGLAQAHPLPTSEAHTSRLCLGGGLVGFLPFPSSRS